tara:strand:+ start:1186 stop:1449 length:264 start_codon:yes stop_codon:yes gene_type:complete
MMMMLMMMMMMSPHAFLDPQKNVSTALCVRDVKDEHTPWWSSSHDDERNDPDGDYCSNDDDQTTTPKTRVSSFGTKKMISYLKRDRF